MVLQMSPTKKLKSFIDLTIFLQDKFKYIEPIKDFFEDTLKIVIKSNICDGQANIPYPSGFKSSHDESY